MDVKTAIQMGDAEALRAVLSEDPSQSNALIGWGEACRILTHPLHFISDMLFQGILEAGREVPLVEALIEAGSDVDYRKPGKGETALIGAASLGAEEVGLKLLQAGAKTGERGIGGETALHWAAMLGENRLVERLIPGTDCALKDETYNSTPLGWAIHGWCNPPAGNHGRQPEVIALLVDAGSKVEPKWLEASQVRNHAGILASLKAGISAQAGTGERE